jgi:hypothetical protein
MSREGDCGGSTGPLVSIKGAFWCMDHAAVAAENACTDSFTREKTHRGFRHREESLGSGPAGARTQAACIRKPLDRTESRDYPPPHYYLCNPSGGEQHGLETQAAGCETSRFGPRFRGPAPPRVRMSRRSSASPRKEKSPQPQGASFGRLNALSCSREGQHFRRSSAAVPVRVRLSGSGAWTRTRITSSKGWRATNCTTPE